MRTCEARAIKVQLALAHVTADLGPLEVVPGSHVREVAAGGAEAAAAVPVLVTPGDVTVYDSTLQHRGGANIGTRARPTFHVAFIGEGAAPTGIPYTVLAADIVEMYGG
jgi:ectoine hydroxylase-related dioxygenase (phytanoyl-CoA dioxygenase family)